MSTPPPMWMSQLSLYLPNSREPTHSASTVGVSTVDMSYLPSAFVSRPSSAQRLVASSVSARNTFPLDQVTALGSIDLTRSTVVPLPVPLRPCSTKTQPEAALSPSTSTMSSATSLALFPSTSITVTGSTDGSAASTPFVIASLIPAVSFSSSSASRETMPSISVCEKARNGSYASNVAIIALVVVSSWLSSVSRVKPGFRSRPLATSALWMWHQ
mmetsp:Transcript_23717/g.60068  ORF Transcript_23717/g.60068 Transcript_23717/m.60068 type:complete len:215 (+) Transcript_23717:676-1320(+)